jgi:rhodanese-related sulfurtransferase
MKKKILSLMLACVLAFSIAPQPAYAALTSVTDDSELSMETVSMQLITDQTAGKYKLIDTAKLKKWVDKKADVVIVDTMPANSYNTQHIPGALNAEVSVDEKDVTTAQLKNLAKVVKKACTVTTKKNGKKVTTVNKNKKIVVYCGFVKCRRSHWAAQYLVKQGYKNVYRQPGGIYAWIDAGYATEAVETETTTTN